MCKERNDDVKSGILPHFSRLRQLGHRRLLPFRHSAHRLPPGCPEQRGNAAPDRFAAAGLTGMDHIQLRLQGLDPRLFPLGQQLTHLDHIVLAQDFLPDIFPMVHFQGDAQQLFRWIFMIFHLQEGSFVVQVHSLQRTAGAPDNGDDDLVRTGGFSVLADDDIPGFDPRVQHRRS